MADDNFLNRVGLSKITVNMLLTIVINSLAYASPHPGIGSSGLVAPDRGLFWAREGFKLSSGSTGWKLSEANEAADLVTYQANNKSQGSLAVKIDKLKSEQNIESYAKKWMKDYINYGFDVLGTQTFQQNDAKGLVIDFDHKKSFQQIRQILFLKGKTAVILTCTDDKKQFLKTLQGCNEITKSFTWTSMSLPNVR